MAPHRILTDNVPTSAEMYDRAAVESIIAQLLQPSIEAEEELGLPVHQALDDDSPTKSGAFVIAQDQGSILNTRAEVSTSSSSSSNSNGEHDWTAAIILAAVLGFAIVTGVFGCVTDSRKRRKNREQAERRLTARQWHGTRARPVRQGTLDGTGYGGLGQPGSRPPSCYAAYSPFEEIPLEDRLPAAPSNPPPPAYYGGNDRKYFNSV